MSDWCIDLEVHSLQPPTKCLFSQTCFPYITPEISVKVRLSHVPAGRLHQQKTTFARSFFYLYNVHKWPTCGHRPSLKSNNVKETVCRVLPQYDDTCDFTTCIKSGNRIYPWNSCFATMLFLWKYICNHLKWHLDLIIMRLFFNKLVNNLKEN